MSLKFVKWIRCITFQVYSTYTDKSSCSCRDVYPHYQNTLTYAGAGQIRVLCFIEYFSSSNLLSSLCHRIHESSSVQWLYASSSNNFDSNGFVENVEFSHNDVK